MVFSSILFIFRFLPIAIFTYFITPRKFRNYTLLILSLIFYSWGEGKYFLIMIASIFVDYFVARGIEKYRDSRKLALSFLCVSLFFNLGILFFFKYFNFFIDNINLLLGFSIKHVAISLPLGISFYTFQTMSYSIDVFKGKVESEKNIINFGAYVCLFPQLIAGPIVKYSDISKELKSRKIDLNQIEVGIETFIIGLSKKVLIANNIGMLWTEIETMGFSNISTPLAWLGILAFALQIYFDFSGYSMMAIGLGKILGFTFPQNFNYPYISRSITEFWRRWHITLGSWFKEYVYIPMGGNRVNVLKSIFNLFIVWFLTGFWHGASYNFILWGLFFFIFISIEKAGFIKVLNKYKVFSHLYVVLLLLLGWTLFAIVDFEQLKIFIVKLFSFSGGVDVLYYLRNYGIIFVLSLICSTPLIEFIYKKLSKNKYCRVVIILFMFIISIAYLVDATYNPFLYFRF